ncbi:MAG TPA: redox-sensing transcriptional repressor Rex [Deltaproteobacteria bacterium]|nr:redox-sensing transcriptional repressor Rex [Deltaproteobacteria bacterium]
MNQADKKDGQSTKAIPVPTLRRLPIYYQYLKKIQTETGSDYISTTKIGNDLKILPIQVRKDIEVTEAVGKPKLGYDIAELMRTIEGFLGWNNSTDGYLVGVGNLGSALLGYQGFKEYGLNIIAAFDADQDKVGTEIHGTKVLPVEKLPDMIKRMGIHIGILTVPGASAQEVTDIMVKAGIWAIWNFSPIKVHVPSHVIVQHENLASSLVVLSKKLAEKLKTRA